MIYAVIMAGGQGTRLWPISRKKLPKQFQKFTSDKSLIVETYERLLPIIDPHNIIISTTPEYVETIKLLLPGIPAANFIIEPFANGNAAACGLVSYILNKRDPQSIAIFLPADHSIKDNGKFLDVINYSIKLIQKYRDHIITVGIKPTHADTGFGYIQFNKKIDEQGGLTSFKVKRFVEKPDFEHAQRFLSSGDYLWNAGLFVWRTDLMIKLMAKHLPINHEVIKSIASRYGGNDFERILLERYSEMENTTIDFGIMEKINNILVVPGSFGWNDIGNWGALFEILADLDGVKVVSRGPHVSCDDEDCLVMASEKLVATIGLKDTVIIDTPDALLICNRHKVHKVKDLLAKLKEEGREEYL